MHKESGDFQTPSALVQEVLACPELAKKRWSRAIEPTCGQGNFIKGLLNLTIPPGEIQAIEIQDRYLSTFKLLLWDDPCSGRGIYPYKVA